MIVSRVSVSGFGAEDPEPERIDAAVHSMEAALLSLPDELKISVEAIHHFVPGLYIRELRMPAGSVLTGKYHRQTDILILAKGSATFLTKDGLRTLIAPCITTVEPNTKPMIRCDSDVVFISAHANPTETRDIDELEKTIVISEAELSELRREGLR